MFSAKRVIMMGYHTFPIVAVMVAALLASLYSTMKSPSSEMVAMSKSIEPVVSDATRVKPDDNTHEAPNTATSSDINTHQQLNIQNGPALALNQENVRNGR